MGTILISSVVFYSVVGLALISTLGLIALVSFLKSNLPEAGVLMLASFKKRPVVQVHDNMGRTSLFAPALEGKRKDGNMYDIKSIGVKIVPSFEMVEHLGRRRHIHFYSKASVSINAKIASACRDFNNVLKAHGITPNESMIDSLLIATNEELQAWYPPEECEQLQMLKNELNHTVIKDGQFVYQVVRDFVFAAQNETSRALDEYKSIAKERAAEDANLGYEKDKIMYIFYFVFLIIGAAIAYKMITG